MTTCTPEKEYTTTRYHMEFKNPYEALSQVREIYQFLHENTDSSNNQIGLIHLQCKKGSKGAVEISTLYGDWEDSGRGGLYEIGEYDFSEKEPPSDVLEYLTFIITNNVLDYGYVPKEWANEIWPSDEEDED
tara:strand:- start:222 stop:617 length:396 start_codon:yes stop_codon:yes gene_type:complete